MSKSELRARLLELGVRPSKMLGQNFLLDPNLAKAIVSSIEAKKGDHLVEVGPGMGALTKHIIDSPATKVTLVERDHRLAAELKSRYESDRVRIIGTDAAKIDLRELYGYGPVKFLGNLPYSASTAIIENFASPLSPVCKMVLMLQREVAERLAAQPSEDDYAALTVLLGHRWKVKKQRLVPPDVFWPRPHVESAIIEVTQRSQEELLPCLEGKFRELVRLGFSSRRKQLRSLLKIPEADWSKLADQLKKPRTARAEDLSIEDWSYLAQELYPLYPQQRSELFDVVDENDTVVSTMQRHLVHQKKLRHRAVHLLIFNKKGELFLQKRSLWKETNPGLWCSSVAGHVDAGEDYLVAAHREMKEELGISTELKSLCRIEATAATEQEFINCYYGSFDGPMKLNPHEIEAGTFFPLALIQQWVDSHPEEFTPVFKMVIKKIKK